MIKQAAMAARSAAAMSERFECFLSLLNPYYPVITRL
jgi:hypothetical protein